MDLTKVHNDHKKLLESVIADEFGIGYTEAQKQQLYNMYVELNKIPKKDWNKQSTKEKLDTIK